MKNKEKINKILIRDFWDLKTTRNKKESLFKMMKQIRHDCYPFRFKKDRLLKSILESGRSMVEMLGVLAVIGVLSVTGIIGYRYAMNKYIANKIANEITLVGTQIAMAFMKTHTGEFELSIGSPYDDEHLLSADYPFYYGCGTDTEVITPCQQDEKSYYAMLENIPESICQPLVQMTQHLPWLVEQRVNGTVDFTGSSCQSENNQLVFWFEVDEYAIENETTTYFPETTFYETPPFFCENSDECMNQFGSYQPVCDSTIHQCVGCLYESDCASMSSTPACYISNNQERGRCVACTDDTHCTNDSRPACRTDIHSCVQCTADEHCESVEGLPVCKTAAYKCVQCMQNSDCKSEENPYCNTSNNVCSECQSDNDCTSKYADTDTVLPYCINGTCKPCKGNYVMRPESKTMSNGLTYHEFCFNNTWVDWSTGPSNGCHLFGTGFGADIFCSEQGGLPSVYDLLLISDNPLKYKEGDEVKVCFSSYCYTYTGPFPATDAYKGKWQEMCPGTSDRPRIFTSLKGVGMTHVEVNMKTGGLAVTADGSGNYWLTVACKNYLNRVSY